MLPSDLTGTMTLRAGELAFRPGPVFTNLLLADEINRHTAEDEARCSGDAGTAGSVDGLPRLLPDPFLVVATQNPIEYEARTAPGGTARSILAKIDVGYPIASDEAGRAAARAHGCRARDAHRVQAVTHSGRADRGAAPRSTRRP